MLAVAAIMLAVLVFVPAADALTCSGEAPHAASVSVSAHAPDLHDDGGDAHDLCGHGHCHGHGTYVRLDQPLLERAVRIDSPVYLIPADAGRGLPSIDGLERPPRA